MATGDPMWSCPFCGKTNYLYVCGGTCDCGGWNMINNKMNDNYTPFSLSEVDTIAELQKETDYRPVRTHPEETLVVNLLAGPGTGKSTICAGIFEDLKWIGIETEMATEYAKDLVWEDRQQTFRDQIYMFGHQYHRIFRLLSKVQVIITDSPILLTPIYDYENRPTFEKLVIEEHKRMWTYNVFLKRAKPYNPKGRNQDEEGAKALDIKILNLLDKHSIPYETFYGNTNGKDKIVKKILTLIGR